MVERRVKERVVFTNGCFDLFHVGHLALLRQARSFGSSLIVGINSDKSVRKIKGRGRPVIPQDQRIEIIKSLWFVDGIIPFDEEDPLKLIKKIRPQVLVKGGDWKEQDIIGADFVKSLGGIVKVVPLIEGISTSNIIQKIKDEIY